MCTLRNIRKFRQLCNIFTYFLSLILKKKIFNLNINRMLYLQHSTEFPFTGKNATRMDCGDGHSCRASFPPGSWKLIMSFVSSTESTMRLVVKLRNQNTNGIDCLLKIHI